MYGILYYHVYLFQVYKSIHKECIPFPSCLHIYYACLFYIFKWIWDNSGAKSVLKFCCELVVDDPISRKFMQGCPIVEGR